MKRDLPGPDPELMASASLDLIATHRVEFVAALLEHEQAGLRFESWPPALQARFQRELDLWVEKHPDRKLIAITQAVQGRTCILIVHHGRGKAASAGGAS